MNMLQLLFELSELLPEGLRRIAEEEPHRVRPGLLELVHHGSRMILHGLDVYQTANDIMYQALDDSRDRYKDEFNRQHLGDATNDQTEAQPPHSDIPSKQPGTPPIPIKDAPDPPSEETQEPKDPGSASLPDPKDLENNKRDAHTSNSESDWGSDTDYTADVIRP